MLIWAYIIHLLYFWADDRKLCVFSGAWAWAPLQMDASVASWNCFRRHRLPRKDETKIWVATRKEIEAEISSWVIKKSPTNCLQTPIRWSTHLEPDQYTKCETRGSWVEGGGLGRGWLVRMEGLGPRCGEEWIRSNPCLTARAPVWLDSEWCTVARMRNGPEARTQGICLKGGSPPRRPTWTTNGTVLRGDSSIMKQLVDTGTIQIKNLGKHRTIVRKNSFVLVLSSVIYFLHCNIIF